MREKIVVHDYEIKVLHRYLQERRDDGIRRPNINTQLLSTANAIFPLNADNEAPISLQRVFIKNFLCGLHAGLPKLMLHTQMFPLEPDL